MSIGPIEGGLAQGALALAGAGAGRVLNLLITWLPGASAHPLSSCPTCGLASSWRDWVPFLTFVRAGGLCRVCGTPLPRRTVAVEMASAALLPYLFWHFGASLQAGIAALYTALFIVIFAVDLEHRIVPNRLIFPALVVAPPTAWLSGLSLPSILAGGALAFGLLLLSSLLYPGGVGGGDVKLAALIGLITGYPGVITAMLGFALLAGAVAAFLLVTGRKGRRDYIPYAPFMVVGATLALLVR